MFLEEWISFWKSEDVFRQLRAILLARYNWISFWNEGKLDIKTVVKGLCSAKAF